MDGRKNSNDGAEGQRAPRVLKRRDGGWAVAFNDGGVTRLCKLTVVPDRTTLDDFEVAAQHAHDELEATTRAITLAMAHKALEDAFALYDFRMGAAPEALTEALRP